MEEIWAGPREHLEEWQAEKETEDSSGSRADGAFIEVHSTRAHHGLAPTCAHSHRQIDLQGKKRMQVYFLAVHPQVLLQSGVQSRSSLKNITVQSKPEFQNDFKIVPSLA